MGLSVIIPTLNAARHLPAALAMVAGDGVTVSDGGSTDGTADLARQWGDLVIEGPAGRGRQMIAGANASPGEWLLFLHADTQLGDGWREEVEAFMAKPSNRSRAAVFRFALNDDSADARWLESVVAWRVRRMGLPYGDQGLLIHRGFYRDLGGFRPLPLMEDVDLVRRIGHRRLVVFSTPAVTSAERWQRGGWRRRSLLNLLCLSLYFLRVPPRLIQRLYS